jgi:uncharacterized protein
MILSLGLVSRNKELENSFIEYEISGKKVLLLAEKGLYMKDLNTLIVADMHLGKAGHLREQGVAVPEALAKSDLNKLRNVIDKFETSKLILLGDLFHNTFNKDWIYFKEWRNKYSSLDIQLVMGNHDILPEDFYKELNIGMFDDIELYPGIRLIHKLPDDLKSIDNSEYLLAAHVHPAVKLFAKGKQYMRLPCFYFTKNYGLLPAFGELTGSYTVNPENVDKVFVVAEGKIFEIKN